MFVKNNKPIYFLIKKMEKISRNASSDKIVLSPKRKSSKHLSYKSNAKIYKDGDVMDVDDVSKVDEFKKRNSADRLNSIILKQMNQPSGI